MLVTLADMKEYLSIASDNTDYNDVITGIINAVGKMFDNYTHRTLESADYTLYLDGNGTDSIFLPNYPINTVTSIHVDNDRNFDSATEIDSDSYVTYDEIGQISLVSNASLITSIIGGRFPKTRQSIKIVCNLGYDIATETVTETLPSDIKKAAKDQIKWLYQKWSSNSEGIVSYSTINNSVNQIEATDILPIVKIVLDFYRNPYHGCV